jgi:hypothetical protein
MIALLENDAVVEGQFDYVQLRHWYTVLLRMGSATIVLADILEDRNRLRFLFDDEEKRSRFVEDAVAAGVPALALLTGVVPPR